MIDKIKWSEWKIHTGGKCPVDPDMLVEVVREFGFTEARAAGEWEWEWASIDDPLTYRYQLPPPETEQFAIVFNKRGFPRSVVCQTAHGSNWRKHTLDSAKRDGCPVVRFYNEDGDLTETVDLREVES